MRLIRAHYVWGKAKRNYYDKGVKLFWLDEARLGFRVYSDNIALPCRAVLEVGNITTHVCALRARRHEADGEPGYQPATLLHGPAVRSSAHWSGRGYSLLTFESLRNRFT